MCADTRCTDGITWCFDCNGHGVLNPKGKKYRVARKTELPKWAVPHQPCNGTGMRACGCTPLGQAVLVVLAGVPAEAAA